MQYNIAPHPHPLRTLKNAYPISNDWSWFQDGKSRWECPGNGEEMTYLVSGNFKNHSDKLLGFVCVSECHLQWRCWASIIGTEAEIEVWRWREAWVSLWCKVDLCPISILYSQDLLFHIKGMSRTTGGTYSTLTIKINYLCALTRNYRVIQVSSYRTGLTMELVQQYPLQVKEVPFQ